ncbi:MAG TPA: DUF2786 domain-containing protein [Nocardioidaceae bacterium]|nr:DUF2786 domain-containing protein [Nocardioidaceae bacterium]
MYDHVLARIRKILAKAENPAATAEEAEAYTAKAAELIAKYGIDRALLAQHDPSSDRIGDRVVVLDPPYALDKAHLLQQVAMQLRCASIQRTRHVVGVKQLSIHLFGFASDLERTELLYTSLLLQAATGLTRAAAPFGESVAAFRRSWLAGFTSAVTNRLREAEIRAQQRAAQQTGHTTEEGERSVALVLADRTREAASAMQDAYPLRRQIPPRSLSGSGRPYGYRAGQRADLGGTRVERGGRRGIAG